MDEMEVVVRRCGEKDASRVPSRHAVVCSRCELELEAGQATGNMYNTSLIEGRREQAADVFFYSSNILIFSCPHVLLWS